MTFLKEKSNFSPILKTMALFVCLTFGMNLIGPLPQTQAQIVPSLPSPGVPSLTLFDALKKKDCLFSMG